MELCMRDHDNWLRTYVAKKLQFTSHDCSATGELIVNYMTTALKVQTE